MELDPHNLRYPEPKNGGRMGRLPNDGANTYRDRNYFDSNLNRVAERASISEEEMELPPTKKSSPEEDKIFQHFQKQGKLKVYNLDRSHKRSISYNLQNIGQLNSHRIVKDIKLRD